MSQTSDNDINIDKLNKSNLENEILKEDDNIEKCEDNINIEKSMLNEELIDNQGLKNDSEVKVENSEEIRCEDNTIVGKSIADERMKNDMEVINNKEPQLEDDKQSVLNVQEENDMDKETVFLDKEEVANDIEADRKEKEEFKTEVLTEDIEEKANEEELNLNNGFDEYKYQIEQDIIAYERNFLNYKQWALDAKELVLKSKKTFEKIEFAVEKFNKEISTKLEQLNDNDKKLVENRIKGINMIDKMSKNVINNGINKLLEKTNQDFNDINIINDINDKNDDEIRNILNENYNSITHIESKKSNLVDSYFKFIETSLLPILDGVESGISFVQNSNKEIIQKEILPVYIQLRSYFDELLLSIKIKKIEVELKSKIDFSYIEVLDIEVTEEEELDETIESVIRNGYEYLKDVYGIGHNHIIRQAQIVAYKYSK